MTDRTELRMNVAALKRVDPYVKDILETATHVALYTFNADENEWEKTNIEGALFVYSRNGEPYNSILIMNRLNTNNLVEPVAQGLDLQLQEPFLLYRNSRCNIYGIWFYEKEECVRIANTINKLLKESEDGRKGGSKPLAVKAKKTSGPNMNNVDIFSMLSKAQEDFNTSRSSGGGGSIGGDSGSMMIGKSPLATPIDNIHGPLFMNAPSGPDVTSQSVMDFFAKAKVNTGHFKAGDQPAPGGSVAVENKPLLARLMSHPAAITLEHIEKQQRSVTPQPSTHHQSQPSSTSVLTPNNVSSIPASNRSKRRNKTTSQQDSIMSTSAPVSQELQLPMNQSDSNGSTGFLRIQSPTSTVSSSTLRSQQTSNVINANNANPLVSLFTRATGNTSSDDIIPAPTLSGRGSAPALMPPVMFAAPSPPESLNRPLEPLTKNQLLQAFNHLLKSDPDFINKLHEAYVKSFGEILS